LLIASNAFSNPCKAYLLQYEENDRPKFHIKQWERKDIEVLTNTRPDLLRKYGMIVSLRQECVTVWRRLG